jgi:hypothetical protein
MFFEFFLIFLIVVFYLYKTDFFDFNTCLVKSNTDGEIYRVYRDDKRQASADTLGVVNLRIKKLLDFLKNKPEHSENVSLLLKRYNSKNLMENTLKRDTTYTTNKGQSLVMCIKQRDKKQEIHDINHLMFVAIHELAHIASKSYGHGEEFVRMFEFLLKCSIDCGIYTYTDYSKTPIEYCGMTINSTPI